LPRQTVADGILCALCAASIGVTSGEVVDDSLTGVRLWLLPLASCALAFYIARLFAVEWLFIKQLARWLGNSSYGVYLLHPLVFAQLMKSQANFAARSPFLFLTIVVVISFGFALLIERYWERPMRNYGKRLYAWREAGFLKRSEL
jgi:peptidoglycan/LPS O-acetylase OafA/YrhL